MEIFFTNPDEVPLPPGEVRIRTLQTLVLPDRKRVKVYLELEPFQKRPNADLTIFSPSGRMLSTTSIIESMIRKIELVMHLRGEIEAGMHTLEVTVFYATLPEQGAPEGEGESIVRQIVDTASHQFEIPGAPPE